jgi:hypothetical protein
MAEFAEDKFGEDLIAQICDRGAHIESTLNDVNDLGRWSMAEWTTFFRHLTAWGI